MVNESTLLSSTLQNFKRHFKDSYKTHWLVKLIWNWSAWDLNQVLHRLKPKLELARITQNNSGKSQYLYLFFTNRMMLFCLETPDLPFLFPYSSSPFYSLVIYIYKWFLKNSVKTPTLAPSILYFISTLSLQKFIIYRSFSLLPNLITIEINMLWYLP